MKKTAAPKLPKYSLRLVCERPRNYEAASLCCPSDAAAYLSFLTERPEEHFIAIHLNAKNEPIGLQEISHGTLSSSLVHPREVFKAAMLSNALSLIVAHNHPSGSKLAPSPEDIATTKQLVAAGKLLGIPIVDHIIFGSNEADAYSIRENYPHLWNR